MNKDQAMYTAAKWWMDTISNRKPHSNGDDSEASIMACSISDMLVEDVTVEQLNMFGGALIMLIKDAIEKDITSGLWGLNIKTYLECDYDPCYPLDKAAKYAKISKHNFPYKTSMCIASLDGGENFTVYVKKGYGEPFVDLKPAVDEHCREFDYEAVKENIR